MTELSVRADRPLVCRLYPLGQKRTGEGQESFHHAAPHPDTEGVYGHDGTIEDFLAAQGVGPFLLARDHNALGVYRFLDVLAQDVEDNEEALVITTQTFRENRPDLKSMKMKPGLEQSPNSQDQ